MKLDRLLGILTTLLQNDRVTAPFLAEKFEVNRRTIGRDIEALNRAGIPIATHQGAGGGISIAEGFKLDKSVLTTDELTAIIAAIKGLGSVTEPTQMERTLDKLGANTQSVISLHEPVVIDLASHYKGSLTRDIEQIKRAVREARLIEFDYFYDKGESRRCIEPYFVIFQWSSWYVFGFCEARDDWRLFKLTRLRNLTLSDALFTPREIPPEKRDFDARFDDETPLTAVFHPREKYRLVESYGHESFTETPNGLLLEIGFTSREFIISWLLGFGANVKVLEPQDIAKEIQHTAEKILSNYI
ncbi:MAG: YafY family transcriptional regulator [Defluviitaleaceae bacterium]|nr:YafY family transcriptional regulator [Defluviitaleaceae bacterium]MCL2274591.1 YafY family transcriptional regulator [Defluviitaleaceae bacterium]